MIFLTEGLRGGKRIPRMGISSYFLSMFCYLKKVKERFKMYEVKPFNTRLCHNTNISIMQAPESK